jgi:hypothetical protein
MDRRSNQYTPTGTKARVLCGLDGTAEAVPYTRAIAGEGVPYTKAAAGQSATYTKPTGEAEPYGEPTMAEAMLCPNSIYEMSSRYLAVA